MRRSLDAFSSFYRHHIRARARAILDFCLAFFGPFYSPLSVFPFSLFLSKKTAHGQDDHPRSRVFGHHRQRQGENPRQRGHPAGSAAIDLRRKTIRRWPNFSRLQHSKRIHLALGLALERRHHRAVLDRLGEKIQPRQEGLPQMLRSITPESGQLQKEEVRAHEPVARQEEVEVNSTLRFLEGRVLCN
jgi:hypothetical protein